MDCDTGLKVFDLSALSQEDAASLRELIIAKYRISRRQLRYDPDMIESLVVDDGSIPLRIGFVHNKPARKANEDVLCDFFIQRHEGHPDTTYRIGFKGRPYGNLHVVLGTREFGQFVELTPERLDIGLVLAAVLGEDFDVFCNRVAPSTSDVFHFQAMIREVPVWDFWETWPVRPELLRGPDRAALSHAVTKRVAESVAEGRLCDLLLRVRDGQHEVLLIPRARHQKRPPLVEFEDATQFGEFGVLEMCGYFVTCKTERAVETVRLRYRMALDALNAELRGSFYPSPGGRSFSLAPAGGR